MNFIDGLLMFAIGTTITLVGFLIAFLVINYNQNKINKQKEPLTEVEKSLKDLTKL
tara:strand:- start:787 stop:954 length:168 start_codon:yes stop_codon:yes gene_type:complete